MLLPTLTLLPIELLLNTILKQYFLTSYCITIISEKPINIYSNTFIYMKPSDNLVEQILTVSEMGCSDYIIRMKKPQKFMSVYEEIVHKGQMRRSDRKILILPYDEEFGDDDVNLPSEVFSMKESSFVANMLMIVNVKSDNCTAFDLITHQFVGVENNDLPVWLDRWDSCSEKFDKQVNLFPHDISNLFGKIVKVACFTYTPYVLLDLDKAKEPLGIDGVEIRLVQEFCRWVNCTIEIVNEDEHQWGKMFANRTGGVGVIGSVLADRADVGIGGLYYWYEEYLEMDFSAPAVRSAVTGIAPAPRLISSWQMPLLPFTWDMWLGVLIIYFFASTGLIISYGCVTTSHPFLQVFGMIIGQSVGENSVSWRIRSVAGWLLTTGLVISSAYGAGLATVFTVPRYESSINTVQDLVDRNMEWGGTHDAWIFSLVLSEDPLVKQLVSLYRIHSAEELERRSYTRTMAYAIEILPGGHFAAGDYLTQQAVLDMMLLSQDFYYGQCVIMLRKSSAFTDKISHLVHTLHQGGLLLAWETLVSTKHLNYKIQLEVRLSRSRHDVGDAKPLRLTNVSGVFIIYSVGLVLSLATFLGELELTAVGGSTSDSLSLLGEVRGELYPTVKERRRTSYTNLT